MKKSRNKKKVLWQKMEDGHKSLLVWNDKLGQVEKEDSIFGDSTSIGTCLGGTATSLRYVVVLSALSKIQIGRKETGIVKSVLKNINTNKNFIIEKCNIFKGYLCLVVLIDWNTVPDDMIRQLIDKINVSEKILRSHYFLTNTNFPTQKEIKKYLMEIKDYDRTDWN